MHSGREVFLRDGPPRLALRCIDGGRQRLFLGKLIALRVGRAGILAIVLLLLDADDVGGALITCEKILAVLGIEEFSQRFDTADDQQQIVLTFEREYGIYEVMPRALVAKWRRARIPRWIRSAATVQAISSMPRTPAEAGLDAVSPTNSL